MQKMSLWKKIMFISVLTLVCLILATVVLLKFWIGDLSVLLPYASELAGLNGGKSYLVLFQNNNELRPGGGFISAYGILDINNGIMKLSFADSYELENEDNLLLAPEPMDVLFKDGTKEVKTEQWHFRDGNFDVSFPEAAKDLESLYWDQSGLKKDSFDGVIAVNFEFLEDLVGIYSLNIGDVVLSKENLFAQLEYETKNIDTHNLESLENRKNALRALSQQLMKEVIKSFWKYDDFFAALNKGLKQKKIILYFKDKDLQAVIENKKWDGSFNPNNYKNFIYTNFANLGGRKSDRYLRRTHKYLVSFDENNRGKVRYTVSLEHLGGYNLNSDTYRAYLRVFLPENAEFLSADGDFHEDKKGFVDNEYFEAYVKMEPGEQRDISIEYLLPKTVFMEDFVLDVIKQSGTKDFWQILVQFSGDNSFKSDGFDVRENVGFWAGNLLEDQHFDFQYIKDSLPPLVVWQRFAEQNLIEIKFSEVLDSGAALNSANYSISDLDYNGGKTDSVVIENINMEGNTVFIKTKGVSRKEEERYKLKLNGLEDLYGNKTKPAVLELTLVQRL